MGHKAELSQVYLCLDGIETGRAVGSLTPQALETWSAQTATKIITLSRLRAQNVTVTLWFMKQRGDNF